MTINRPPFDAIHMFVAGLIPHYTNFDFTAAPLSSWHAPVCGAVGYLTGVGLLCAHMRGRPKDANGKTVGYAIPKWVVVGHNLLLSLASFAMFVGCSSEVVRRMVAEGWEWFFCESIELNGYGGPLYFWSYAYYLSKYWEFLDTVLVVLRGSSVPHFGLQVYHHAGVILMAWLWCSVGQSLQFGGVLFNCFVHTVMYHYYAMQVLRVPTPWKRYITRLQIVQFLTSFFLLIGTLHFIFYEQKDCAGCGASGSYAFGFNILFNVSLLYSFLGVNKKYSNKPAPRLKDAQNIQ